MSVADATPDDSFDVAPADDEAVARILVAAAVDARLEAVRVALDPPEALALVTFAAAALRPLWRVLADETLARVALDLLRALSGDPDRPTFDDLRHRDRRALVAVVAALRARLIREGSV